MSSTASRIAREILIAAGGFLLWSMLQKQQQASAASTTGAATSGTAAAGGTAGVTPVGTVANPPTPLSGMRLCGGMGRRWFPSRE